MDAKGQLGVFCLSVAVGFVGGILYEFFALTERALRRVRGGERAARVTCDILFFLSFAALCIFLSYAGVLPSFRWYLWLGYALGGILYLKTLRRMVAFLEKLCYNGCKKIGQKAKKQEKTLDRREKNL